MKGRILITALALVLALVLALGALTALNVSVSRTELPVEMEVQSTIGDKTAAEGLTVDYRVAVRNCLRWYTSYRPAEGTNETEFFLTYRQNDTVLNELSDRYGEDTIAWSIVADIGSTNVQRDPIVRQLWDKAKNGEGETQGTMGRTIKARVYPFDYYDYYPLRLSADSGSKGISRYFDSDLYFSFDKLKIPADPRDFIELGYYFYMAGDRLVDSYCNWEANTCVVNQFTPYSVRNGDTVLATVGFDAGVEPKAEWAPEGFGLWEIPIHQQEVQPDGAVSMVKGNYPVGEESRLVYPLDIEQQRVMLLRQSRDGKYFLLVTVENDRYVLRVLDSGYQLVGEFDLSAAEVSESSFLQYLTDEDYGAYRKTEETPDYQFTPAAESASGVNEFLVEERFYPAVTMKQGENFVAVMMNDRLAVLSPAEKGYELRFVCDTVSYGAHLRKISDDAWEQTEADSWLTGDDQHSLDKTPTDFADVYPSVSERCAMAYNGTYLASALYRGSQLLLSIYGPDGLAYGEVSENSVLLQDGGGFSSVRPVSQAVVETVEDYWYPVPGLRWA